MNSKIWFEDIKILFHKDLLLDIIPTINMSNAEKVNTITRFLFYLSILLFIVKQNYLYFYIFIIPVVVFYVIYIFNNKETFFNQNNSILDSTNNNLVGNSNQLGNNNNLGNIEPANSVNKNNYNGNETINGNEDKSIDTENDETHCQNPTEYNPLMNVMPADNFYNKKKACSISDKSIASTIDSFFSETDQRLFNDTNTIYNNRINQRPFYTMPNSQVPNNQTDFAKWLYETPITCQEGNNGLLKSTRGCAYNFKSVKELKEEL